MSDPATCNGDHERGTEGRRREDDPHERADGGARPGAVLSGLLLLGHLDLALVVPVHQRDVGVSSRVVCRVAAPASVRSA